MCRTLSPGAASAGMPDSGSSPIASRPPRRHRAADRIGVDVELDLAHALGLELLVERRMGVLPGLERRREASRRASSAGRGWTW